jgi:hypothetical protein
VKQWAADPENAAFLARTEKLRKLPHHRATTHWLLHTYLFGSEGRVSAELLWKNIGRGVIEDNHSTDIESTPLPLCLDIGECLFECLFSLTLLPLGGPERGVIGNK